MICFSVLVSDFLYVEVTALVNSLSCSSFDSLYIFVVLSELVGIFLQNQISQHYNKNNIGLYRDDGLAVFRNVSGPQSERIKKKLQKLFKNNGLEIVIECNKKIVDYLDITLNLNDGTYKPYSKPDSKIQYINTKSNHPPNIINQIPKTIEKRLSEHSSNEQVFNETKHIYEKALQDAGHQTVLNYNPPIECPEQPSNRRKRNIIWFNPPYSKNVSTKIAKRFLNLIDKHFPNNHRYHKLFNRNSIKVSYSCTSNMKSIIDKHNHKILKPAEQVVNRTCNCINKDNCPLNGNCLITNTVYEAKITTDNDEEQPLIYLGSAETTFKKRFSNHKKSFNHERYENETELSKAFWKLKRQNKNPKVSWKTIRRCVPTNGSNLSCNLCLSEKLEIALRKSNILNSRSELVSKCRHINKFTLLRFDTVD